MPDITIWAPWGAGGNHLRWLLLLDSRFIFYNLYTVDEKIKFIFTNVYNENRTFRNWLSYEWRYKSDLQDLIYFEHPDNLLNPGWDNRLDLFNRFNIFIESRDKFLPYKLYRKFNSNFNGIIIDSFIDRCEYTFNEVPVLLNHISGKLIDLVDLYCPLLDKDMYHDLIDYLQLDDNYQTAQKVHYRWFELQIRAEKDFVMNNVKL